MDAKNNSDEQLDVRDDLSNASKEEMKQQGVLSNSLGKIQYNQAIKHRDTRSPTRGKKDSDVMANSLPIKYSTPINGIEFENFREANNFNLKPMSEG